jgi:hypothetical protein
MPGYQIHPIRYVLRWEDNTHAFRRAVYLTLGMANADALELIDAGCNHVNICKLAKPVFTFEDAVKATR